MTIAEEVLGNMNPRQDSSLHKALEANGYVRDSGYGYEIYQFTDGSIMSNIDGRIDVFKSIKDISL